MRVRSPHIFLAALLLLAGCSSGDGSSSPNRSGGTGDQIDPAALRTHLEALSRIADDNSGTRAAGSPGYEASVEYVTGVLKDAGFDVEIQRFDIPYFEQTGRSVIRAPGLRLRDGRDFRAMLYSEGGTVTGELVPIGFEVRPTGRNGAGCDAGDFTGVDDGDVVLLRPGPCYFRDQVAGAAGAGAAAAIISVPEWPDGRPLRPTLLDPDQIDIPALATTDSAGVALFARGGDAVRVRVAASTEQRPVANVVAELPGEGPVVMVGGHLDSVIDGPGINDNGSGVAAILEVAGSVAEADPSKPFRVALWAGEELGLLGSSYYVASLDPEERAEISIYLNLDMLASTNAVTYIYSELGPGGIAGETQESFERYFDQHDLAYTGIDLEGRSDHGPFLWEDIPVGGLFSGADMTKTPQQAERFGGESGEAMDPCYHLPCDDLDNIDHELHVTMAEALLAVVMQLLR